MYPCQGECVKKETGIALTTLRPPNHEPDGRNVMTTTVLVTKLSECIGAHFAPFIVVYVWDVTAGREPE
jgi:hypothetical protein